MARRHIGNTRGPTVPHIGVRLTRRITPAWDWILRGSLFALLSGLIGSFYPSVKAAAQDPVEALAYE